MSSEAITAPVAVNEYAVDEMLSGTALALAKPGDIISWTYAAKGEEPRDIRFSLSGLTNAIEWAECAQAQLASGKSGPPTPEDEKPEFSPAEPGVPVDPVGDGKD